MPKKEAKSSLSLVLKAPTAQTAAAVVNMPIRTKVLRNKASTASARYSRRLTTATTASQPSSCRSYAEKGTANINGCQAEKATANIE